MYRMQPKPAPTFFDFVTDTTYQLFNEQSITVKEFYTKFNEYKVWLEKQEPSIHKSRLEKELINFENALSLAQEQLESKQHPYFNNFANDIKIIIKYKEEIEKLIKTNDEVENLKTNTKTVRNSKGNLFQIEVKSKKLHINTGTITLSWSTYYQLLVYLFIKEKLIEKNDQSILTKIAENTLINSKYITDTNIGTIVERSKEYITIKSNNDKIKTIGIKENNLTNPPKKLINNKDFMLKLEENCNELIRNINS